MMKHTPGPWKCDGTINVTDGAGAVIIADTYVLSGEQYDNPPDSEMVANARLIAAAPDLLWALENLYAMVQGECPSLLEDDHHDGMVRNAIAKAKGEK